MSIEKPVKRERTGAEFLIFLCWLVYSVSYLGKVNYSANITKIIEFYHVTKAEAGMPPTFFFFAYGIGQIVNGFLCRKYNIKYVIFTSLFASAAINLFLAVNTNFAVIKWLWMLNGFVLSMLWPTLIRLLSGNLPKSALAKSTVAMGTTVASGTMVIYSLSSLYAHFDYFQLAFYTPAVTGISVGIFWLFSYRKAVDGAKAFKNKDLENPEERVGEGESRKQSDNEKRIFAVTIGVLCLYAVGINFIKDGLTTWVPSILKEEYGIADSLSILLTLLLPMVAIFGNIFALSVHKRIPDYVSHCTLFFVLMLGFIGMIVGSIKLELVIVMLIGLVVVSLLASSLNSLITSIFPIFMRDKLNSGMFAGILNGFCYAGSTLSAYGLGIIADNYGWTAVFLSLMAFCAVMCIAWAIFTVFRHIVNR